MATCLFLRGSIIKIRGPRYARLGKSPFVVKRIKEQERQKRLDRLYLEDIFTTGLPEEAADRYYSSLKFFEGFIFGRGYAQPCSITFSWRCKVSVPSGKSGGSILQNRHMASHSLGGQRRPPPGLRKGVGSLGPSLRW